MKRAYSLLAIALIAVGTVFSLRSSRANDDEQPERGIRAEELSGPIELIQRIEALERRIATLEAREPLVRQADNSESPMYFAPVTTPPARVRNSDDSPEKTNGVSWRFHMLSHRQPTGGTVR